MVSNEDALSFLEKNSVYANRWLSAHPDWRDWLGERIHTPVDTNQIDQLLLPISQDLDNGALDEAALMSQLRLSRQQLMLWIGCRDLNGIASLSEVTQSLSYFAEQAVSLTVRYVRADLQARFGLPWARTEDYELPFLIVGMGKLGGRELNLSSDIDLIFLYEEEGETQHGANSISNHEWFTKLGRRLIKIISEHDAYGFVFRVDMRLRPNGDSGPLVCSLEMLEEYLFVQGREWERYAWIKGRMIYPSISHPDYVRCEKGLEQIIRPFIYRRHLDYGVIAAIRELHAQIQREADKRSNQRSGRSRDIKLGRGGIREIEFLAQMFQLMRGGTDPRLRIRPTLEVLDRLQEGGLMNAEEIQTLKSAYVFLRRLEHRIQIWEDQQTHYLPENDDARMQLAQAMAGPNQEGNLEEFMGALTNHQNQVARCFEKAFALDESTRLQIDASDVSWQPNAALFPKANERWDAWQESSRAKSLPEKSRLTIRSLLKKAANDIEADHPADMDQTLLRFFDLLEAICRRSAYLSILAENSNALQQVLMLLNASQWAAQYLARHPHLLDDLLSANAQSELIHDPESYWSKVKANLDLRLDDALADQASPDHAMDILRVTHHTETFLILLADLGIGAPEGLSTERVSDRLSALADLILQATYERVWPSVANKFGLDPQHQPPFAVIAYGKLGGKELGYASDLDLVFLYDASPTDYAAQEIYSVLGKRMINWLTTLTAAGTLFEIDTRLRPNGAAGFLVTSLDSFRRYQLREGDNAAWVWEHQAISRARFAAGDPRVGAQFEEIRKEVLAHERNQSDLKHEIIEMRHKVHAGHPNASNDFDLKHDPGGMVDIEFIVQYLVLAYARQYLDLLGNLGNIALLGIAAKHQLISEMDAIEIGNAYRMFRAQQHRLRLDGAEKIRVSIHEHPDFAQAKASVTKLWETVFGAPSQPI
ncbi:bifunctional [glutamate--ammonia ligase]-adenylyl-L-tyrosine phosphorylase/[glutamate--ammonia-ligase] adenylyltransferase [Polynucleobacter sp. MWH-UH24A]|uniref:bifunctional [glutamate--ammonia ligase]-adenylyl-L-tyrosine phosphorylase/[glutamate--ammonia-ligase] adenylyltransferase n=1 Tax=Polynucleobacter sp. MWH-UH24A TaxID=2689110 RepID=UPI001BFEA30E|nr:bifunctional [glutamate--ammonia ligase]-adenylyl-L-tyrosine phosphorylase/[glutamate--ammonia-ligase] adenylyltransferase [Polynucleobacter sp. MWH-UH24A]QWD75820.1 bifunctional [glutamate--ammonia ligase]-adenylyl-L-tyrosine phosphorylase/[glutamate--ammonia-ligase] adenylyltransferase [Polynucleobacter sp. MWH-UH24A]